MLEKYLNKEVIIEEKLYEYPSINGYGKMVSAIEKNRIEGIITDIQGNFIELDNNSLINIKHIYRIILK